ncbi:response regulator [Nannocystis pusilla]|jgi:two-component system chemotaxis response regulator CheY|uniref:Response regulator n=1 Tax=Nannocystis pusilla TaxID=889268 RepID=A0ABS7TY68_9BACT|nr:response regulator [Nannocystis pusilla]MBZ5713080.1 response regulator [Nannocystis pusilla]
MPIRALVVDDSAAMRTFVSSVLESTGDYDVDEVGHGFEAIRLLPRGDYSLFVFDVNMPDFNGIELIRAVREHPRYSQTPLVVMTTEGRLGDVERARAAGAKVVITKPFTPAGLLAAVAEARGLGGGD